jgi:hypothetical protein
MLLVPVAICLVFGRPAEASHLKKGGYAVTDPRYADADFTIQGEYQGSFDTGQGWQKTGLQVVARGHGAFDAVLFPGGLPGSGWTGWSQVPLTGKRTGNWVELRGGYYHIVVEGRTALVYTANGNPLGQIARVERQSPSMGTPSPWGAQVLFNGRRSDQLVNSRISPQGWLMEGTQTRNIYRDYTMHVEFRLPYMPYSTGQARANSGVYLQSRYEVQILDSFGLEGLHNECAGLYKFRRPDVNMCLPPLVWQTYDIEFRSPRFDSQGRKTEDAVITVWHNGVAVHQNVLLTQKTGGGKPEAPELLPIKLQDHHNPVRFRNVWIFDHSHRSPSPYAAVIGTQIPYSPIEQLTPRAKRPYWSY